MRIFWTVAITSFFLASCGGGGGGTTPITSDPDPVDPITATFSVDATFVKGLVSGASCELFEVGASGAKSTSVAIGTTTNGLADFGNAIEYQGTGLIECTGGSYTDEATGATLTAPMLRAVVNVSGDGSFVVSPLTEIAAQLAAAETDFDTALTTHNDTVASAFGLDSDITTQVPTDLSVAAAGTDDAGEYGTVLALISQLNDNDAGSLSDLVSDLATDLADDTLSVASLADLTTAVADLATSSVSSNISDTALANVVASAGIPVDDSDDGGGDQVADQPNILFILSDDQGVDASAEYDYSLFPPTTPTISQLAADGVIFQNAWATPACSTTRAAILTGKHGVNSGVISVPGNLNEDDEIIYEYLANNAATSNYASAYIGKWHLNSALIGEESNPVGNGIPYYAGSLANLTVDDGDYTNWELTEDSTDTDISTTISTEYNTSVLTRLAENWIAGQDSPWFLTLAYAAPHSPIHLPDSSLHTRDITDCSDSRECFLAMIEAMDTEIGNLLDTLSQEERDNTVIIFVGDNGTGNGQRDQVVFTNGQVKGSLFEGGLRVPMVVSGAGVSRADVVENSLITVTDMYATIAELAGADITSIYDSISFAGYLSSVDGDTREHAYSDYFSNSVDGWSVRNDTHQLINDSDAENLYFLSATDFTLNPVTDVDTLFELQIEAARIRGELASFSASPTGDALDITDGGNNGIYSARTYTCARFVRDYTASVSDLNGTEDSTADDTLFTANLSISVVNGTCVFESDGIPNHDMQDTGRFATTVSEQDDTYQVTATPEFADEIYFGDLGTEQGIYLNGVKIDIYAAACLGVGVPNERIGCGANTVADEDEWRFDPMFSDNGFRTDSHNAHTQPSGAYHYHGSPNALFDGTGSAESGVVGFAADGFPIFGLYIGENGQFRKVTSSYRLISGNRPTLDLGGSSAEYSEQPYNGAFRQDYVYEAGSGDLDECNGMTRDGGYGYYVTEGFPYIVGCFMGTPDDSFLPGGGN
jgi:arylsulfatase A-like enzyme